MKYRFINSCKSIGWFLIKNFDLCLVGYQTHIDFPTFCFDCTNQSLKSKKTAVTQSINFQIVRA